jgi:hypothetical protein
MRNVTKESMQPNQQALHDPWKDTTDDLEELDPDYDDGFTQLPHTVSVNPPLPRGHFSPTAPSICGFLRQFAINCSILLYFHLNSNVAGRFLSNG